VIWTIQVQRSGVHCLNWVFLHPCVFSLFIYGPVPQNSSFISFSQLFLLSILVQQPSPTFTSSLSSLGYKIFFFFFFCKTGRDNRGVKKLGQIKRTRREIITCLVSKATQKTGISHAVRHAEVLSEGCAAKSFEWINITNNVRVPVHGLNFPTATRIFLSQSQWVTLIRPTVLPSAVLRVRLLRLPRLHIHRHLLPATDALPRLLLQLRKPTRQTRFFRPTILHPPTQPLVAPPLSSLPPS
jgi:hypothetical protein